MNLGSVEFAESPSTCAADLGPRRAVLSTEEPFRISKILSSVSFFCVKSSGVSLGRLKLGSLIQMTPKGIKYNQHFQGTFQMKPQQVIDMVLARS